MIIKRIIILQAVVALSLSTVFLMPKQTKLGPAGISLALPADVGVWSGKDQAVTERELKILSSDTQFARRLYTNPFGDEVLVSIVLSGEDMNNSIHRPERCLPAQGWTIEGNQRTRVAMGPKNPPLDTTRLANVREIAVSETRHVPVRNIQYYWFIGSRDMTASHLRRTLIDVEDRVLRGENQRWAYVTIGATVTDNIKRFGRTQAETTKMVEDFMAQIVPKLQKPDGSPTTAMIANR